MADCLDATLMLANDLVQLAAIKKRYVLAVILFNWLEHL